MDKLIAKLESATDYVILTSTEAAMLLDAVQQYDWETK